MMDPFSPGCCVDKACNSATCMQLHAGETCGECVSITRCEDLGVIQSRQQKLCDWFPRRYEKRPMETRESHEHVLVQLRERLRTQDNRATAHPLFCVQEEERIYGIEPQFQDDHTTTYIWQSMEDDEDVYGTDADLLAEHPKHTLRLGHELIAPDKIDWSEVELNLDGYKYRRILYVVRWMFVSAHFTEAAADEYVSKNRHNLTNPRVYVTSQHRCHEWISVVEHLGDCARGDELVREVEQLRKDNAAMGKCLKSFGAAYLDHAEAMVPVLERARGPEEAG